MLKALLTIAALVVFGAAVVSHFVYRFDLLAARSAWTAVVAEEATPAQPFDPAVLSGLPEPARRYLAYSIAPGTPLRTTVELEMRGEFALGDRHEHRVLHMRARQVLAPPHAFVWAPQLGSGLRRISGSDGYVAGRAWTRFWLLGIVPVARASGTSDLARSAAGRSLMEAIWAPASLLPQAGARWEPVDDSTARVTFDSGDGPLSMSVRIAPDGRPLSVQMLRWSDANPERVFRWQPFGGTLEAWGEFGGYTIPTRVEVGNHFGTEEYFPFFRAQIVSAHYH
jgi:hypothetical protein